MGMKLISLFMLLLIVILLFGTKRLRHIGSDLAEAINSFRKGLKDESQSEDS